MNWNSKKVSKMTTRVSRNFHWRLTFDCTVWLIGAAEMLHVKVVLLKRSVVIVAQRYGKEDVDHSLRIKQMLKSKPSRYRILQHRKRKRPIITKLHSPLENCPAGDNIARNAIAQDNVPISL